MPFTATSAIPSPPVALCSQEVLRAVGNTVTLAIAAAIIGFTMGILLGLIAGYFRETWIDKLATSFAIAGVSVPHYWLGMVLVIIFSVELNWLPAVGAGPGGSAAWAWDWDHIKYPRSCRRSRRR